MKEFWSKYKLWFILGGIALVIGAVIGFYFWAKRKGQKEGAASVLADAPGNPSTGEPQPFTVDEKRTIRQYVDRLNADINGWFRALWRDSELYDELKTTSDRVLVGCYNQYQMDNKSNLISDLENEIALNPSVVDNTRAVVARLKSLIKSA